MSSGRIQGDRTGQALAPAEARKPLALWPTPARSRFEANPAGEHMTKSMTVLVAGNRRSAVRNSFRLFVLASALAAAFSCGGGSKFVHKNFLQPNLAGHAAPDLASLGTITSLVAANGRFYIAGQTGAAAVNPDGSVAWTRPQPSALMRYVSAANGKVALSSFDSPAIKDLSVFLTGKVEFTAAGAASVTLLSDAGDELWSTALANPDWLSSPTVHTSTVAVQSGSALHIFGLDKGDVVMTSQLQLSPKIAAKFPLRQGRTQPARIGDNYYVGWGNTHLLMAQNGKEVSRYVSNEGFFYAGAVQSGATALFAVAGMDRSNGVSEVAADGKSETRRAFATRDCFDFTTIGGGFVARCGESLTRIGRKGEPSWTVRGKAATPSLYGGSTADEDMRSGMYGFNKVTQSGGIPVMQTVNFDASRAHSALTSIVVGGNGHIMLASRDQTGDVVTVLEEKKGQYVGTIRANGTIVGLASDGSTLAIATTTGLQFVAMP